jgi:hypothetical protein
MPHLPLGLAVKIKKKIAQNWKLTIVKRPAVDYQ